MWRWRITARPPSVRLLGLGLDELFQLNFNGTLQSSVLKDPLGSVVGLSGSSKTITDRYQYEPYGASTHTSGTSLNNYQFAGQANDFNNLYYMRNRYYLPAIGRFIYRDPSGLGGGTNMYAYAGDDPVNFSDPTGLEFVAIGWGWGFNIAAVMILLTEFSAALRAALPGSAPELLAPTVATRSTVLPGRGDISESARESASAAGSVTSLTCRAAQGLWSPNIMAKTVGGSGSRARSKPKKKSTGSEIG